MTDVAKAVRKEAKKSLDHLKETLPLVYPVSLQWNKVGEGRHAESFRRLSKRGNLNGYIGLSDYSSLEASGALLEVLLYQVRLMIAHEYAHLMAWDYPGQQNDAVWASAYNECYGELFGSH